MASDMEIVKPTTETASRIFIACAFCKARKRKCDGKTPRCSNCVVRDVECNYAAIRRTRGPGKRDKTTEAEESRTNAPWVTDVGDPGSTSRTSAGGMAMVNFNIKKPLTIFPPFLVSKTLASDIRELKTEIKDATATGKYSPLLPLYISRELVENSFAEVIPEPRLISLEKFIELLYAQHADSTTDPGEDAARWAVVNSVIALAGRFKIAAGSEAYMSPIALGFYRNASLVIHQLILHRPSLLSVQALLSMAIFARGIPDMEAFFMLAKNAFNQLEILQRTWSLENPLFLMSGDQEFTQVYQFASQLSEEAYHLML